MSESSQEAAAAAVSMTEMDENNKSEKQDRVKEEEVEEEDHPVTLKSDIIETSSVSEPVPLEGKTSEESVTTEKREVVEGAVGQEQPPVPAPIENQDRSKIGECNLLPVLVEQLRTALEQSCSWTKRAEELQGREQPAAAAAAAATAASSSNDSVDELRAWASGLGNSAFGQQRRKEGNDDETQNPRGLKLDLKFLEDLLVSDIQTALERLRETLRRLDIGTLARHSSSLDSTNKLNLLKLISSLLANLKIPEEAIEKSGNTTKSSSSPPPSPSPSSSLQQSSGMRRRRAADRHTIGVSAEELARARKWLEGKRALVPDLDRRTSQNQKKEETAGVLEDDSRIRSGPETDGSGGRVEKQQFQEEVREKYMKNAINQQQSLQRKHKESSQGGEGGSSDDVVPSRATDSTSHGNDCEDPDEYGGLSAATSVYHRSNVQAKSNKFLAKKSKIKRANTIDIPNYLKLQAESLANGRGPVATTATGCVSLRRPINIGDRYAAAATFNTGAGSVIPSFEPKTENDRKFLALINKNIEASSATTATATAVGAANWSQPRSPFKSFNYHRTATASATAAENNWNNRFSNIKTTFDKPTSHDDDDDDDDNDVCDDSHEFNGNWKKKSSAFSHAPTSPFRKIGRAAAAVAMDREGTTPAFLKSAATSYIGPKPGNSLRARVKMFDRDNGNDSTPLPVVHTTTCRPCRGTKMNETKGSSMFENRNALEDGAVAPVAGRGRTDRLATDSFRRHGRITENGNNILNYQSLCKELTASVPNKNPINGRKTAGGPWLSNEKTGNNEESGKPSSVGFRAGAIKFSAPFNDDRNAIKVPVAYQPVLVNDQSAMNDKEKNNSRHQKLYETYEGFANSREIFAYPFEVRNYQEKHPATKTFKRIVETPRSSIFAVQSVGVQTNPLERRDSRTVVPPEIPQRREAIAAPKPLAQLHNDDKNRDLAEFAAAATRHTNYPGQGRNDRAPPKAINVTRETATANANYPLSVDCESDCYHTALGRKPVRGHQNNDIDQSPSEIPSVRSDPPKTIDTILQKEERKQVLEDCCEKHDYRHGGDDDDNRDRIQCLVDYDSANFYHSDNNPIYLPAPMVGSGSLDGEKIPAAYDGQDIADSEETIAADRSFGEENIANQDISATEGVVTRYACAIGTVSSASESPIASPSLSILGANDEQPPAAMDPITRHNLLQQNLIKQLQAEESGASIRRFQPSRDAFGSYGEEGGESSSFLNSSERKSSLETASIVEGNNTQEKIKIFERRRGRRPQEPHSAVKPACIPRGERDLECFVTPKINVVSPSKVFTPSFVSNAERSGGVDSSDEYLMSCANRPSRNIVLSKSESWHQLAMSKTSNSGLLRVPERHESSGGRGSDGALLKPPKPKSPSSLKLSKQYEASTSSDSIKKMEEKIQRYFKSPGGNRSDSPSVPARSRRETAAKNKRDFGSRQGNLMRSHTMPHIYDDSTADVEKAFDSLFKEATRSDSRS